MTCSIPKRDASGPSVAWIRLLSANTARPSIVSMPSSWSGLQTSSAASSVQRPATGEGGEPLEEALLSRVEQLVTPVDGSVQGALPSGQVPRAAREDREASLETVEDRDWREQRDPGGGQLDGQRQTVEPAADLGHHGRVLVGEGEVGLDRAPALNEQRDRLVLREPRARAGVADLAG
jgi:hypothetical protein